MNARLDIESPRFHACRNDDTWTWTAAVAIAGALRRDLQQRSGSAAPRSRLLLSGGTTPAPVFRALSQAPLEWNRVDIGLVDERWLLPSDADSNAHLVTSHLMRNHAAAARFEPLTRAGRTIEAAVGGGQQQSRPPPAHGRGSFAASGAAPRSGARAWGAARTSAWSSQVDDQRW